MRSGTHTNWFPANELPAYSHVLLHVLQGACHLLGCGPQVLLVDQPELRHQRIRGRGKRRHGECLEPRALEPN